MWQRLRVSGAVVSIVLVAACTSGGGASPTATGGPSAAPPSGSTGSAAPSVEASGTPIPVEPLSLQLDFTISGSSGALLWGIDKGFFEEAGIDLDIIPGRGSDLALNQLDAGQVDFAMVDGSNYVAARAQDVSSSTALYAFQNVSTTAIASKEQINEPEDMIGKSFGTVAQSSGRVKIPLVLELNGVDPSTTPVELMDFSVLYPTLFEGAIDTAEVGVPGSWEGAFIAAQQQGITLYVKLISDWGYRDYSKVLIASDDVIAENEDLVRRFVEAIHRSQADALANATGEEIFELVRDVDPQVEEEAVKLTWEDVKKYIIDPGPMDDETFQFQLEQLEEPSDLDPSELYTNEYVPGG